VLSFCDFNFIKTNFFFLKSTKGRGFFDLFCSFMFLATVEEASITSYIMMAVLMVCGCFFVAIGCLYTVDPAGKDIDSGDLKTSVTKQALLS
jgi:hypothetical protein